MQTVDHLSSVRNAINSLNIAIRVAKATLPDVVQHDHWIAKQHSPDPWENIEARYILSDNFDQSVAQTLTHLKMMSRALADLTTVAKPEPLKAGAPNLKLARSRINATA